MANIGPIQTASTCLTSVYDGYSRVTSKVVKKIFNHQMLSGLVLEILLAPYTMMKSVFHYLVGRVSEIKFHKNGLNPTNLKALKAHKVAVLCLHGCMANQGSWISFSKRMNKAGIAPAFSMDLNGKAWPWNYDTSHQQFGKDVVRVQERINAIRDRYTSAGLTPPKFVLVGHSRGGEVASLLVNNEHVEQVISLGNTHSRISKKIHEISGRRDYLAGSSSLQEGHTSFNATHMELLYNRKVQEKTIELISEVAQKLTPTGA